MQLQWSRVDLIRDHRLEWLGGRGGVHNIDGQIFFFVSTRAHSALTTHNARCSEKQKGRGDQEKNAKAGEDADDLGTVPDHGGAGMSKLVFARPFVVVTEKKVVVK